MTWLLLATIFGIVHTQPLFFRPHQSRENEKGVCCSDGTCCPPGKTCGEIPGQCIGGGDLLTSLVSATLSNQPKYVYCPGSQTICADGNTCCKRPGGGTLCCPYANAVCCSDGRHCCPFGLRCSQGGICTGGDIDERWSLMRPALNRNKVPCDETHQCPDKQTCCKDQRGRWKCCPLQNAVCCGDRVHCCPQGMKCGAKTCTQSDSLADWFFKTPARRPNGVICPDGRSECEDGQTCCKLPSGSWACCPIPKAVCCSDGLHCCPQGTTCSVSTGKCNRDDLQINWVEKTPAREPNLVPCSGGQFCPDNTKCCKKPSGGYGCCPSIDAVCCSDGLHCCPQGTTCSVSTGTCNKGNLQIDWVKKTPAIEPNLVPCPGGQFCPDNTKCCAIPSGGYGCCPFIDGVCCSDGVHCCPKGSTCSAGQCVRENSLVDIFVKKPAVQLTNRVCPDGKLECQDNSTCCQLPSGDWGCCSLP